MLQKALFVTKLFLDGWEKLQINIKTSSQLYSMVEEASWFGAALLPQGLDSLLSPTEK
jgi:hypothetical protein